MKRRTILLITSRSDLGGGPRHVFDLLRGLKDKHFRFVVASPNQPPFANRFKELADLWFEIPERSFSLGTLSSLRKLVRSESIDLIHSHGRGAGTYSRPLGSLSGQPVLHTFHGIHAAPGPLGRIKLAADQALALFQFTAIFGSQEEERRAHEYGVVRNQECIVLPNAVDLSRFAPATPTIREKYRVGAFLRADFVKGPDLWLDLVRRASRNDRFANVIFTCAGITRDELTRFGEVPAQLEVAGRLESPDDWLKSLDIYVSTARAEGLPLGILEALAASKPCLLSHIPAHETFFRQHAAKRFDANSFDHFAVELENLINNIELRTELADCGRTLVEKDYSLDVFATRLSDIYHRYSLPS